MDLVIAGAYGLGLSLPKRHAIAAIIATRAAPRTVQRVAQPISAEEPNRSALFQQDREVTAVNLHTTRVHASS